MSEHGGGDGYAADKGLRGGAWTRASRRQRTCALAAAALLTWLLTWQLVAYRAALGALFHPPPSYAAIIDAGSSGSRIHVFKFVAREGRLPLVSTPPAVLKLTPGLSAFADSPAAAVPQLEALLSFAERAVPRHAHGRTPVVLLATAGLRLLPADVAEALLAACRPALHASPFLFQSAHWARLLPGEDEGAFAWIAANYAVGTLEGNDPRRTVGVLELGGASAQVTFAPSAAVPAPYRKDVRLPPPAPGRAPLRYSLYTHSFLGLGLDAAFDARPPPQPGQRDVCAPPPAPPPAQRQLEALQPPLSLSTEHGAPIGAAERALRAAAALAGAWRAAAARARGEPAWSAPGVVAGGPLHGRRSVVTPAQAGPTAVAAFDACRAAAAAPLRLAAPCAHAPPLRCVGAGAAVPPLRGAFLAVENFAHTRAFLRLPRRATLAQLAAAGAALCAGDVSADELAAASASFAAASSATSEGHTAINATVAAVLAARHCFGAAYSVAFLHDAFGVGLDEARIAFTSSVRGMPVDWALGALVAQYGAFSVPPPPRRFVGVAAAAAGVALFAAAAGAGVRARRRRPRLSGASTAAAPGGFKRSVSALGL